MATSTAIAIYFLVWWLTLFAILPWGISAQGEEGPAGTDPGAPRVHGIAKRLVWTTLVSAVLFGAASYLYIKQIVTLDGMAAFMGLPAPKL